jgi:hypothetical protein
MVPSQLEVSHTTHTTTSNSRSPLLSSVLPKCGKIFGPNGKLISSEQLRLIHILLQATLRARKVMVLPNFNKQVMHLRARSNVVATGTFTKFPVIILITFSEIKKITQRASPVVALT